MPTPYQHLSSHERDVLAVLRSRGQSLRQIAAVLQRAPSTLARELRRNAPPIYTGYYLAHKAQHRAQTRNRVAHQRPRLKSARLRRYVATHLRAGWSPELIAGRWTRRHPDGAISHEAIYQWVYAEAWHLVPCLVRAHRQRRYRGYVRGKHRRVHIPQRVSIRHRPAVVQRRRQFGHWETDTMISRASAVAFQITVERTARYTKLARLPRKGAREMRVALTRRLRQYPRGLRRSLTYDNGSENTEHVQTNDVLGSRSYFCEPFHSWERGTVENTIGLVRRFFPKQTDLARVSTSQIQSVERWLNHRPRKCLGFRTPAEVFKSASVALAG